MVFSLEHDIKVTKNHQNLLPTQSVLVAHTVLLLVILLFNVIVDINIGVPAYLTQFINTYNVKMTYVRQCVD
jgi:hypothetical protein